MIKIKQIFYHFSKWEDFKAGLYNSSCERFEEKVKLSVDLLSNQEEFYEVAVEMFNAWTYSAEQNLTDNAINKNAWIGQASCCFNHKAPDYATKEAWWKLDEETRAKANNTARRALRHWRSIYIMKGSLWES